MTHRQSACSEDIACTAAVFLGCAPFILSACCLAVCASRVLPCVCMLRLWACCACFHVAASSHNMASSCAVSSDTLEAHAAGMAASYYVVGHVQCRNACTWNVHGCCMAVCAGAGAPITLGLWCAGQDPSSTAGGWRAGGWGAAHMCLTFYHGADEKHLFPPDASEASPETHLQA